MNCHNRLLETQLLRLGSQFPIIVLTGARQVGKTTLLRHLLPASVPLITFDPVIDLHDARLDPEFFLDQFPPPIILDEIQYAPELLNVIKRRVDQDKTPGQYWITGSQNFSILKNISESLAGRAIVQLLHPMTLGEREQQIQPHSSNWLNRWLFHKEDF